MSGSMPAPMHGRVLFPGAARGPLLRLTAALSFWGGVDPASGTIILGSHPERGRSVAGRVLALARPIGSSSSSAVLLELIHRGCAPAAILLGEIDAILVVGCLAARELGLTAPPVLLLAPADLDRIDQGEFVIHPDGQIAAAA
jgi:predicted aconitase with swiveling domain